MSPATDTTRAKTNAFKRNNKSNKLTNKKCTSSRIKTKDSKLVSDLQLHDVIIQRGKGVNKHFGNELYQKLVASHRKHYDTHEERKEVAEMILNSIKKLNPPGRFLMISPVDCHSLYEISDQKVITKIYQSLRYQRGRKVLNERESTGKNHFESSRTCLESTIIDVEEKADEQKNSVQNNIAASLVGYDIAMKGQIEAISCLGKILLESSSEISHESREIFQMLVALPNQPESGVFHIPGIISMLCKRICEIENSRQYLATSL